MKKKIVFVEGNLGGLFSSKTCKNCLFWEEDQYGRRVCTYPGGPFEDVHTDPDENCYQFLGK